MSDSNGWHEHKLKINSEIKDLKHMYEKLDECVDDIRISVAKMELQSKLLWAAILATLASSGVSLIDIIPRMLGN